MICNSSFFFFAFKATIVFVLFYNHFRASAFVVTRTIVSQSSSSPLLSQKSCSNRNGSSILFAGMGMGVATKKKKGGKNKKKNKNSSAAASQKSPFDVNASLIRMEKKYDELMLDVAKELKKEEEEADSYSSYSSGEIEMITSEYVVCTRASSSSKSRIRDWVPVAQLCLKRQETDFEDGASDEMVRTAISAYCRELSHLAAVGAPVFSTIARNDLQYGVESVDSFHKYVYDEVVETKETKNPDQVMTKAEARETLGLSTSDSENAKSEMKQAYRKLSFELHPDRFEGTPEECEAAKERFYRVKLAYDTLQSGVREEGVSWYESLGGKERTGFCGPVELLPLGAAQETMVRHKSVAALCGFDPVLVQSFVARQKSI